MKLAVILFSISWLLLFGCKNFSVSVNETYEDLNETEKDSLKPIAFDKSKINSSAAIMEINDVQLKELVQRTDSTWLYIWATSCPPCVKGMYKFNTKNLPQSENQQLIILSVDNYINKNKVDEIMKDSAIDYTTFIYKSDNSTSYLTRPRLKEIKEYLCGGCEVMDAYPTNLFFHDDLYLYHKQSGIVSKSDITKYF